MCTGSILRAPFRGSHDGLICNTHFAALAGVSEILCVKRSVRSVARGFIASFPVSGVWHWILPLPESACARKQEPRKSMHGSLQVNCLQSSSSCQYQVCGTGYRVVSLPANEVFASPIIVQPGEGLLAVMVCAPYVPAFIRMVSPGTHAASAVCMLAQAVASLYPAALGWRAQLPPLLSIHRFAVCAAAAEGRDTKIKSTTCRRKVRSKSFFFRSSASTLSKSTNLQILGCV